MPKVPREHQASYSRIGARQAADNFNRAILTAIVDEDYFKGATGRVHRLGNFTKQDRYILRFIERRHNDSQLRFIVIAA